MRAAWWWIDRWRTSSAYANLTMAEQGAYRNLLDELWLRDGLLPDDDRLLERASGAGSEWAKLRENVLDHFTPADGGYRHATHDAVQAESQAKAKKAQNWRDRNKVGWKVEIDAQNGLCGCCSCPFEEPWSRYVVRDHDHITNKNRALVCQSCNRVIWAMELGRTVGPEKADVVRTYLRHWKERSSNVPPSLDLSLDQDRTLDQAPKNTEGDRGRIAAPKRAAPVYSPQELASRTLSASLGSSLNPCRKQVSALIAAGWTVQAVTDAIAAHAEPGLAPWDWTKRACGISREGMSTSQILAFGHEMDRKQAERKVANAP